MATRWRLCVCSLGILLLAPCSLSEEFSLTGSPHPVVGVVGQDVVLPCQLSPQAGLPSMDVQWRKAGPGFILVHEYMDEGTQDLPGEGYQTRTELFLQEFSSGNVSLKLKRLQVADDGTYHCFVRNPEWTLEATTELQIAAVAPVFIDVLGPRGQGIGLACRTAGWFPKPELQWVGKNWQNLAMEIVTNMTQDRENLYSVVSHVTVTEGEDNGDISCIVRNGPLETERHSAIHLSGDIFPRVSPWLAAFWVIVTLVLIAAGGCAYLGYTAKRKASQKKRSKEETLLNLETEKTTLDTECQELRKTIDAERKALESERAKLHETLDAERKVFESERQELRETIASKEKKIKELESEFRRARSYMGALRAPTLYLSQTSTHPGASVRLQCSVFSRALATRVIFCKDGEEILSQTGSVEKLTYNYDHVVSRGSSGSYSCGYEIKDSDNQVNRSQLSPAQHLSITGSTNSSGGGEELTHTGPVMSLAIWATRCTLVLLLLVSVPIITFFLEKWELP
ncbi:butyrophilin-like protein 1 [Trachemys scripta elegans]|uniref:butyrophilin-like protein 1 n=1 Tax=Trachemys scripta elegans TaxID=31138 RepID=UPI0015551A4C|nr:butyrophilin-like protein 1 [Trachemys scripta elegans]